MDPASRIIAKSGIISEERIACGAWKKAVGRNVALRTRALKLVRTTLVVEVDDEIWKQNLRSLRYQIINNLAKAIGPEIVTEIEFRVMPPRVGPQRAGHLDRAETTADEAEAIADPGLRRIYKAARRRETA